MQTDDSISRAIYIGRLLFRQADGQSLTDKERQAVDAWVRAEPGRERILDATMDRQAIAAALRELLERYDTQRSMSIVFDQLGLTEVIRTPEPARKASIHPLRWAAAAAVVLLVGAGAWLVRDRRGHASAPPAIAIHAPDIPPGTNKAILTLAGGRQVVLDSTGNGPIAQQGSVRIVNRNGHLVYEGTTDAVFLNKVATPRGGQYQFDLPDGSRVWLNAASSITFPTAFVGGERKVTLTGEAFFDVARDQRHPFVVEANGTHISVLGTSFDVMAYGDEEALRTTLVQGAVSVSRDGRDRLLAPGEQAIVRAGSPISVDAHADVDKAIAWKTGYFMFDDTDLKTLMREVSRWYDIDVVYGVTDFSGKYGGRISRNSSLRQLTELLEGNNIYHYKIDGRKLIVLP